MNIDKNTILSLLQNNGQHAEAAQAGQQLPDQVDTDQHAGLLSSLGINLPSLLARFGGGAGGLGGMLGGLGGGGGLGSLLGGLGGAQQTRSTGETSGQDLTEELGAGTPVDGATGPDVNEEGESTNSGRSAGGLGGLLGSFER